MQAQDDATDQESSPTGMADPHASSSDKESYDRQDRRERRRKRRALYRTICKHIEARELDEAQIALVLHKKGVHDSQYQLLQARISQADGDLYNSLRVLDSAHFAHPRNVNIAALYLETLASCGNEITALSVYAGLPLKMRRKATLYRAVRQIYVALNLRQLAGWPPRPTGPRWKQTLSLARMLAVGAWESLTRRRNLEARRLEQLTGQFDMLRTIWKLPFKETLQRVQVVSYVEYSLSVSINRESRLDHYHDFLLAILPLAGIGIFLDRVYAKDPDTIWEVPAVVLGAILSAIVASYIWPRIKHIPLKVTILVVFAGTLIASGVWLVRHPESSPHPAISHGLLLGGCTVLLLVLSSGCIRIARGIGRAQMERKWTRERAIYHLATAYNGINEDVSWRIPYQNYLWFQHLDKAAWLIEHLLIREVPNLEESLKPWLRHRFATVATSIRCTARGVLLPNERDRTETQKRILAPLKQLAINEWSDATFVDVAEGATTSRRRRFVGYLKSLTAATAPAVGYALIRTWTTFEPTVINWGAVVVVGWAVLCLLKGIDPDVREKIALARELISASSPESAKQEQKPERPAQAATS